MAKLIQISMKSYFTHLAFLIGILCFMGLFIIFFHLWDITIFVSLFFHLKKNYDLLLLRAVNFFSPRGKVIFLPSYVYAYLKLQLIHSILDRINMFLF